MRPYKMFSYRNVLFGRFFFYHKEKGNFLDFMKIMVYYVHEVLVMRVVAQRVKYAKVSVDGFCIGSIQQGFLLLVGICMEDEERDVLHMAKKCAELRVFEDENGKMNRSLADVGGDILSISQFTLYADCKRGRRPSFTQAAKGNVAKALYEKFNTALRQHGVTVATGVFGADMKVELLNDGPVTILLDSAEL